jgi:hypothetical protein
MLPLASALCLGTALLAGFLLCRALACANVPALLGAAAWALSDPLLRPDTLAQAGSRGWPGPSLVLPFALAGAFSRSRARWPFLGLALVCLVLRWRSSPGPTPEASRALDALVLAVLAALGAQRLWDGEGGPAFLFGAAAVVMAGAHAALEGPEARFAAVEVVLVAAAIVLVSVLSRETRARSGLVALLALLGAEKALELGLEAKRTAEPAATRRAMATAAAATPPRQ